MNQRCAGKSFRTPRGVLASYLHAVPWSAELVMNSRSCFRWATVAGTAWVMVAVAAFTGLAANFTLGGQHFTVPDG